MGKATTHSMFPTRPYGGTTSRPFSSSFTHREDQPRDKPAENKPATQSTSRPNADINTIPKVPKHRLPSHRDEQRWHLSRRLSHRIESLIARFVVFSQQVNNYTGTDYSGIEALRKEILECEADIKVRRAAIDTAKHVYESAHAQKAASQKEVVALLERKHSWTATDLERYMSLIRSEHANDQAVAAAKEGLVSAERALEESRAHLEKHERMQYHEEQIWSDTIRRNSTWVTFGLMGFNLFILLATLVVVEPWRRKRMVREIKAALEEQKAASVAAVGRAAMAEVEADIDAVVPPEGTSLEQLEAEAKADAPVGTEAEDANNARQPSVPDQPPVRNALRETTFSGFVSEVNAQVRDAIHNLTNEQSVRIRRVDLTTIALESAAVGAAVTSLIFMIMRSR